MGYSINYYEVDANNKTLAKYENSACFGKIFDNGIYADTTKILLCVEKSNLNTSEDLFKEWVGAINDVGFPNVYKGLQTSYEGIDLVTETNPCYMIEVLSGNWAHLTMLTTALTLLRYAYDYSDGHMGKSPFRIVENYKRIITKLPNIDRFHAIVMAHILYGSGGHHLCHLYNNFKLFSFSDFEKCVEKTSPSIYKGGSRVFLHKAWSEFLIKKTNIQINNIKELYNTLVRKNKLMNVLVVGGDMEYVNWLPKHRKVKTVKYADLVVFTGGEDVSPELYGEQKHRRTYSNINRDNKEKEIFEKARKLNKKMLGICRGSQFLCVMSGGKLVQHQENPQYIHSINTTKWGNIEITSTHHQAQYPYNLKNWDYKVLGFTKGISKIHQNGEEQEMEIEKEAEIVYYTKTNCLGIQGHPEHIYYQKNNPESLKVVQTIFNNFINNEL